MKHLRYFKESGRVVGFKLRNQQMIKCSIYIEAEGSSNIKFKLMDLLDDLKVEYDSVTGGGGKFNNYNIICNIYGEGEAQSIINDIRVKLILNGIKVTDATFTIKD